MNLLVLTDLHLSSTRPSGRIGDYVADVEAKLAEVVDIANSYSVAAVLCAGDLFHRPDASFSAVSRFISFLERLDRRFITISGSHDLFGNNMDSLYRTAIGSLDRLGCIELLQPGYRSAIKVESMTIGVSGSKVPDIELVHGSILPRPDFGDYTLLENYNTEARVVVVGHYHGGYDLTTINGCTFVCPGSLVRVSASEVEMARRPRVAIITDTYEIFWHELVSVKDGSEVLSPPIVVPKLSFVGHIQDWHISAVDHVDTAALIVKLGSTRLSKECIDFTLRKWESARLRQRVD